MNINLDSNYPIDAAGEPETFQAQIDEHQDIMRTAGYNITGPAILLPDDQKEYPGSYQVWSTFFNTEEERYMFLYVDPEGRVIQMDELPPAEFMANE